MAAGNISLDWLRQRLQYEKDDLVALGKAAHKAQERLNEACAAVEEQQSLVSRLTQAIKVVEEL